MAAMAKTMGILGLLSLCFGCFADSNRTQYIAIQEGKKLRPYAKVVYKISVDRREVVYWVESPAKDRSQLYKLKNCIIADLDNWEGEADNILLWKTKVKVVDGKFGPMGKGLANISWFEWHFETDPKPTTPFPHFNTAQLILFILGVSMVAGISFYFIFARGKKLSQRERNK